MDGKYFTEAEFACKCGCGEVIVRQKLIDLCDAIRERVGVPLTVTSGYRCTQHNEAVGGVPNSCHTKGVAADLTYDGIDVDYLAAIAADCGADGIGVYKQSGFVHVDVRGEWARWWE